jgi:hypothetical protein
MEILAGLDAKQNTPPPTTEEMLARIAIKQDTSPIIEKADHFTRALNVLLNQDVADFTYPFFSLADELIRPNIMQTKINPWWKKMSPRLKRLVCIEATDDDELEYDFLLYIKPYMASHHGNRLEVLEMSEYHVDDSILCSLVEHFPNLR